MPVSLGLLRRAHRSAREFMEVLSTLPVLPEPDAIKR